VYISWTVWLPPDELDGSFCRFGHRSCPATRSQRRCSSGTGFLPVPSLIERIVVAPPRGATICESHRSTLHWVWRRRDQISLPKTETDGW
jgi:hypothetical protein